MTPHWIPTFSGRIRPAIVPLAIVALWAANPHRSLAQNPAPSTFTTATEASQTLFQAVQQNQEETIKKILGGPSDLASSQDDAQDKADRELFVEKYQQMHRLGRDPDGSMVLYIGAENWPFPIPIVQKDGAWRFDSDAGMKEVMFRRIGENEINAIAICHEFVAAEKEYRANPDNAKVTDSSPISLVAKAATQASSGDPVLYHGYYFRVLNTASGSTGSPKSGGKSVGSFLFIAYPANYRSSGVMTFVATSNDIVYEKDLGAKTSTEASTMGAFRKNATWHLADQ